MFQSTTVKIRRTLNVLCGECSLPLIRCGVVFHFDSHHFLEFVFTHSQSHVIIVASESIRHHHSRRQRRHLERAICKGSVFLVTTTIVTVNSYVSIFISFPFISHVSLFSSSPFLFTNPFVFETLVGSLSTEKTHLSDAIYK